MSSDRKARFQARVQAETGKTPAELGSVTPAGVTRQLVYDAEDVAGLPGLDVLPGEYPYARG